MPSALAFLALPSLCVFLLLTLHGYRNLGRNKALAYFGCLFGYGWIRAVWLQQITSEKLESAFPYLMNLPVLKIAGVSLQEMIGWTVAVTISWWVGERLLRRFRIAPGPHRIAAVAAFLMCVVCLAVETAAIGIDGLD